MSDPFSTAPEALFDLRESVDSWLNTAQSALLTFSRHDGAFSLDSNPNLAKEKYRLHPTASARSYVGLMSVDRWSDSTSRRPPDWVEKFRTFCDSKPKFDLEKWIDVLTEESKHKSLNNFDIAHLTDYSLVHTYINRFHRTDKAVHADISGLFVQGEEWRKRIVARLKDNLKKSNSPDGQVSMELGEKSSKSENGHFFVTLHSLRSLSQIQSAPNSSTLSHLITSAERFCIAQAFYSTRQGRHQLDIVSLVFALVLYTFYGRHVDKDLCDACINAIAKAQQPNESWPATHPIVREDGKPWHITSHEIALSLTWLYFQPKIPDSGRSVLLEVMERHFRLWIVRTYTSTTKINAYDPKRRTFSGWFDDHTIEPNLVMGWATAIVCHYLSNYSHVLSDHINRRVIETCNLSASSANYLIDEDANKRSPRWLSDEKSCAWVKRVEKPRIAWPDLPPVAWLTEWNESDIQEWLRWKWTDPSLKNSKKSISRNIVGEILSPIFDRPGERPARGYVACILPGVPGTRKTTLVNVLSELMRWPMVGVPPSVIFEAGFDSLEARASELFRRLNYLTGCVIFFDEFEEFLRDRRGQEGTIHDRTIAAFLTSSMLPRFQELNEERRCLMFLATNHIRGIDDAILRPGRFDFSIEIKHPQLDRIVEYLGGNLTEATCEMLGHAPSKAANRTPANKKGLLQLLKPVSEAARDVFGESENVRFSWIKEALREVAKNTKGQRERRQIAAQTLKRCRARSDSPTPPELWGS